MEHVQARDAKNAFGDLMHTADHGGATTITHYGNPRAVVVPYSWFLDACQVLKTALGADLAAKLGEKDSPAKAPEWIAKGEPGFDAAKEGGSA